MKTMTSAAAVLALTLVCPGVALAQQPAQQTPESNAAGKQAGSSQDQSSLSKSLTELDDARQQIAGAGEDQLKTHIDKAKSALTKVQADIQGMQGAQANSANRSLVEAKEALVAPQPRKAQIVQALETAVKDARQLQTHAQSSGQQRAGANGQGGAQISVEQQAAQIGVQQPSPQITVQQPPPQVTVNQPPPQVNIERPEPQVNVQQAEPKVTIEQPKPQVQIEQQGQAQVDVQRQGQPQVRTQNDPANSDANRSAPGARNTGAADSPAGSLAGMTGEQLTDKELYTADNRNVGEVEDVVMGANARIESVLVDVGGFLGLGARRVSIPIEQLRMEGDRLRTDMTKEQLEALPEYNKDARGD